MFTGPPAHVADQGLASDPASSSGVHSAPCASVLQPMATEPVPGGAPDSVAPLSSHDDAMDVGGSCAKGAPEADEFSEDFLDSELLSAVLQVEATAVAPAVASESLESPAKKLKVNEPVILYDRIDLARATSLGALAAAAHIQTQQDLPVVETLRDRLAKDIFRAITFSGNEGKFPVLYTVQVECACWHSWSLV